MARTNKHQKVNVFRLSLSDAETHREITGIHFSTVGFYILAICAVVVVFALTFAIIALTPVRTIIPGYPDPHTRRAAVQNAIKADSLERVITKWQLYSENLVRVVEGSEPIPLDSIIRLSEDHSLEAMDAAQLAANDSTLRSYVSGQEQFGVSPQSERVLPIEGLHFYSPLKGVISQPYDAVLHPYIDISAPANSVVMSVLDGTVIFAGWNDETGYTIAIQHSGDILTVYKHNEKLLRKEGDKVSAGTSIALIGGAGSLTGGEHLHFELWCKGEALDPALFINF